MSNWYECLAAGKRGERLVINALNDKYCWVEDVADKWEYRVNDIDLIVDGTTVEVKNDLKSNTTNNIFVEVYNKQNVKRGGKGWFYYCKAEYFAFVQENKGLIHFVSRSDLYSIVCRYPYRQSEDTAGYCVPIGALKNLFTYKCMECEKI